MIALSTIVKNEEAVIERMLRSVTPLIDYFLIVDTGSADGTKSIILDYMKSHKIPGRIYNYEFTDFSDCRNHALNMLRDTEAAFSLTIDAKEELVFGKDFDIKQFKNSLYSKTEHKKSMYNTDLANVYVQTGDNLSSRPALFNLAKPFYWRKNSPIHEVLLCEHPIKEVKNISSTDVLIKRHLDGSTWTTQTQKEKYTRHAEILLEYVTKHGLDSRNVFYLAQSYRDAGDYDNALKWYRERVSIKNEYIEERYYAQFMVGLMCEKTGATIEECVLEYERCSSIYSLRAEHLLHIILLLERNQFYRESLQYSSFAFKKFHGRNPMPEASLFIDAGVYEYKLKNCLELDLLKFEENLKLNAV